MATNEIGAPPNINYTDKRRNTRAGTAAATKAAAMTNATVSNAAMDTSLLANGYTQLQVDKMTQNDKVYALRIIHDAASI